MDDSGLHDAALRLLARRNHSCKELEQKLLLRKFSLDAIKQECARLLAAGLLNDVTFGESYIRMRANRGYGPIRITQELLQRGLEQETIEQSLAESDHDWTAIREQVIHKKFGDTPSLSLPQKAKMLRFVQYRGFSSSGVKFDG